MASPALRAIRASRLRASAVFGTTPPRRFAHQSYGNEQSGHEQGLNEANPKRHLEHPGPETPASRDASNQDNQTPSGTSGRGATGAGSARPAIYEPKSAAEDSDPEVRKHNEEMRQRADRSVNQLGEEDNKVDKKFWQGDVGDIKNKEGK